VARPGTATFPVFRAYARDGGSRQDNWVLGAGHEENHVKRSIKLAAALLAVFAVFAGLATPAGAHSPGVVVFEGNATFTPGLSFPDESPVLGGPADPASGTFSISLPQWGSICFFVSPDAVGVNCALSFDGSLGAGPAGIGPACGMSSGNSAAGSADTFSARDTHNVAFSWAATAGSVIPITGTHAGGGAGILFALVSVGRGNNAVEAFTSCLTGTTHFKLTGVAAFL
jgi:hypothetical protein